MKGVPTAEQPAKLAAATQALAEREEQLRFAEAAVAAAEEAVVAGHRLDVEAVAAARERGEKDPPARHEEQARRELAAEREAEIAQARVSRVRAEHERIPTSAPSPT